MNCHVLLWLRALFVLFLLHPHYYTTAAFSLTTLRTSTPPTGTRRHSSIVLSSSSRLVRSQGSCSIRPTSSCTSISHPPHKTISASTTTSSTTTVLLSSSSSTTTSTERSDSIMTTGDVQQQQMLLLHPGCNQRTKDVFRGKTVLITGASGGLGRSLALQLAHCGVKTLVLSARKRDALEKVADECRQVVSLLSTSSSSSSSVIEIHIVLADLAKGEDVQSLVEQTKQCIGPNSSIDVLVNNGGVSSRSRFIDTKIEVDQMIMQINFLSGAALAKAFVPTMMMKQKKGVGGVGASDIHGRIIWISSVQGLFALPNRSSYAASKFAVQGYCEALRAELTSSGIIVHTISPGYIRTDLSQSAITGDGKKHGQLDATTAAGANPNDVAIEILNQVAQGKVDFCVATTFSAIAAIYMRFFCPNIFRNILIKRYEKSLLVNDNKEKTE